MDDGAVVVQALSILCAEVAFVIPPDVLLEPWAPVSPHPVPNGKDVGIVGAEWAERWQAKHACHVSLNSLARIRGVGRTVL